MSDLVDLHLHLLPGLDDGPATVEESVALARGLQELGYATVCATPHRREGWWDPAPALIAERAQQAAAAFEEAGLSLQLCWGGENHLQDSLLARLDRQELVPLGAGRGLLLELPETGLPQGLPNLLFELRLRGLTPVIAHPERYDGLSLTELAAWRERGALAQVSLTSLGGKFGGSVAKRAVKIIERGQGDLVASDAHGVRDLERAREALVRLERLVGKEETVRLAATAPARLLRG